MDIGVEPLGRRIVIQFQKVEDSVSAGGVHLVNTDRVNSHKADVIALGPDVTRVDEGDLILVTLGAGSKFEHNQEEYLMIDEMDVLATLQRV